MADGATFCSIHLAGTQTIPISELGGWKHTTALNKSYKTNRHQAFKHLRQHWCYGNWSVIFLGGNRGGRRTFRNWGDIGLSPASRETTQTNKPPKHYTKTGGHNISSSLKKKGNIPNGSVPPKMSKSNKRRLTSLYLNAKVVRLGDEWQVRGRSTASLDCLLSKWSDSRPALPTDSPPVHHSH